MAKSGSTRTPRKLAASKLKASRRNRPLTPVPNQRGEGKLGPDSDAASEAGALSPPEGLRIVKYLPGNGGALSQAADSALVLRPFQQLRKLGDVGRDAPRLIAREQAHGLARPVAALSLNNDYFCRVLAIGLKCSSILLSPYRASFSNITTPSSKAGAGDLIEPESIITGMPSFRSCAIKRIGIFAPQMEVD